MLTARTCSDRRPRRLFLLFLAVLVLLAVAACGGDDDGEGAANTAAGTTGEASGEPIVIGFAIAKTGFLAAYDGPPRTAAGIAIEEINTRGGINGHKLEIVEADTKSDQNQGASAALEVIDKGAEILVVSCDFDYGGPAAREAQKRNMLAFSTCAGSLKFGPIGIGDLAFTMGAPGVAQGAAPAEWAYEEKGWRTGYVLVDKAIAFDVENCLGASQRWKELGGSIVGEDSFQFEDQSISAQVTRLAAVKPQPDVLMLCSSQPALGRALRQIRAAGIDVPIISGGSFDGDYWKNAVPNASNVYFGYYASIYGDDPDKNVNELVRKFQEATGDPPPTSTALTGYSVIESIAKALEENDGSTDGAKLAETIEGFKDEPLVIGPTTFDDQWHIALYRPLRILQIQDGKTSYVTTWKPKKVPIPKNL